MENKKKLTPRRWIALSLAVVLVLSLVTGAILTIPSKAADTSALGSLEDYFAPQNSEFTLTTNSSRFILTKNPNLPENAELLQVVQLAQKQFAADGYNLPIVWYDIDEPGTGDNSWRTERNMFLPGDIYVDIRPDTILAGAEGYEMGAGWTDGMSNGTYTLVWANDARGLLYGLNTLQKHFRYAGTNVIKGFHCYNTPDTAERTVQLDCARKYLTLDYIKNFIKEMSWMGYNTLQLHVSEDGGFRADFWDPAYYVEGQYEPENDLTWVCGSHIQSWVYDWSSVSGLKNYRNDVDAGKRLETSQLIEIINLCKEYHIDIVPSFDSPAHMDYLTWQFEQNYKNDPDYSFTYGGQTYNASTTNGCINHMGFTGSTTGPTWNYSSMNLSPSTDIGKMSRAFILTIYKDMADFFKYYAGSTKFNIGGDEFAHTTFAGGKNLYSDYVDFVNNGIYPVLNGKGYTVRMFNDMISDVSQFKSNIEILYWNSPWFPSGNYNNQTEIQSVNSMVSAGRTLYNCIQTSTYYVLRISPSSSNSSANYKDARSASNRQWTFYHSDEVNIYEEWNPAGIREYGDYDEPDVNDVPSAQLGGGYFLTWHDWPTVNTEVEVWNGVSDQSKNPTGEFHSLRDRMWSNAIKQWNWDVNGTLSYASFADLRNKMGDFPCQQDKTTTINGTSRNNIVSYTGSYASGTTLPATNSTPIHIGDKTALGELINNKEERGSWSAQSWAAYLAAYARGKQVYENPSASVEQINTAITDIETAIAGLVVRDNTVTVNCKATINGSETLLRRQTATFNSNETTYEIFLPALDGFDLFRVDGSSFEPSESGDGSGYLTGPISGDVVINVWYQSNVNTANLNALIINAVPSQALTDTVNYTTASWSNYTTALSNAKKFVLSSSSTQTEVDTLVAALSAAQIALTAPSDSTWLQIEPLTNAFPQGQQVGLYIKTSPNVTSLSISKDGTAVDANFVSGEVQVLEDGDIVKYWVIFFPADVPGSFTYTVTGTAYNNATVSETVNVTVS